jgi:DNA repair protein RecO (recombination protein O)
LFYGHGVGWLRGLAKNARKSRIRFGGHLEPFSIVELTLRPRKRDDLVWIDEAQIIKAFLNLRTDFHKFVYASHFLEISSILSPEGHPESTLFNVLEFFLQELECNAINKLVLIKREIELLSVLGYAPQISHCVFCGQPFLAGQDAVFRLTAGGACHKTCLENIFPDDLMLSPNTLAIIKKALASQGETITRIKVSQKSISELRQLLSAFERFLRGAEINSIVFMEKLLDFDLTL